MGFRLEVRFDYICFFATGRLGETVAVLPNLQPDKDGQSPLRELEFEGNFVGPHYTFFRWRKEQLQPGSLLRDPVKATDSIFAPRFEGYLLSGDEVEIWVDGKNLNASGSGPDIHGDHLNALTGLAESGLTGSLARLDPGYLDDIPALSPRAIALKKNEEIELAARLRLRGGALSVTSLSSNNFALMASKKKGQLVPLNGEGKRIARQVTWSVWVDPQDSLEISLRPFGLKTPTARIRLAPAPGQEVVTVWLRNCDDPQDFNLGAPAPYSFGDNYEPMVYQTLTEGYTGFANARRVIHRASSASNDGVCAPCKEQKQNSGGGG